MLSWVVRRMRSDPGTVLSLCSGMCVELYVMLELGFNIAEVLVVESSHFKCQQLVTVHGNMARVIATDVTSLHVDHIMDELQGRLLAAFASPPNTPWVQMEGAGKPES